jgi:hypothetical protein
LSILGGALREKQTANPVPGRLGESRIPGEPIELYSSERLSVIVAEAYRGSADYRLHRRNFGVSITFITVQEPLNGANDHIP